MKRCDGRRVDDLRPMKISYNVFPYADGSVLIEFGSTKILCAVTLQQHVPPFLRGQGVSWLTAEYALLPASTKVRTSRESSSFRRAGRSIEISRLIGRALRSIIDDTVLGEYTITVDCDVLQADGGTRAASITGASAAVLMAQQRWLSAGIIERPLLKEGVAAVSIALFSDGTVMIDPDYEEDSMSTADMNVIMTYSGKLIELQGGAEKEPMQWNQLGEIHAVASKAVDEIVQFFNRHQSDICAQDHVSDEYDDLSSVKKRQQATVE